MRDQGSKPKAKACSPRLKLRPRPNPSVKAKAQGALAKTSRVDEGQDRTRKFFIKGRRKFRMKPIRGRRATDRDQNASVRNPKTGRFIKGFSGNELGRPEKRVELPHDVVVKALLETILNCMANGKRKRLSGYDALIKRTLKRALDGDARAATQIFSLVKGVSCQFSESVREKEEPLTATDEEIIEYFVAEALARSLGEDKGRK